MLVGGADEIGAEDLGGFDEPKVFAGDGGGGEIGGVGALQGLGDAAGEGGGSVLAGGGDSGEDVGLGDEGASGIVDGDEIRFRRDGGEAVGDGKVALGSAIGADDGLGEGAFIEQLHALRRANYDDFRNCIAVHEGGEGAGEDWLAVEIGSEFVETHTARGSGGDEDGGDGHKL